MFRLPLVALALAVVTIGCRQPDMRPPVDEVLRGDRGLQSREVVQASSEMARSLLSNPNLNASGTSWTIVVDRVEDLSTGGGPSLDVFLDRLRVELFKQGNGRITFIENREKHRALQSRELEQGGETFGQGGTGREPGPAGTQPEYALYCKISDLPNRQTQYYFFEFTLSNMQTRQIAWTDGYEVRVLR